MFPSHIPVASLCLLCTEAVLLCPWPEAVSLVVAIGHFLSQPNNHVILTGMRMGPELQTYSHSNWQTRMLECGRKGKQGREIK